MRVFHAQIAQKMVAKTYFVIAPEEGDPKKDLIDKIKRC